MHRSDTDAAVLVKEIDQLAREKMLDRDVVFTCLEEAYQKVAKSIYGDAHEVRVSIDRASGKIMAARYRHVVEDVEDAFTEIAHDDPQVADLKIGDEYVEDLPLKLGRSEIQMVKQSLIRSISEIERERQFEEFEGRAGELVTGSVKSMEFRNLIIDLGRAEGIIFHNEMIPREKFRIGDRVKAYIYSVERRPRGAQIFLSRTHPQFLAKLFAQEVPEVAEGTIEIKAVARDPGSRAKVAVSSRDSTLDPIGCCVGVRGNRVNAVGQEIQEKIDVILWSPDPTVFVVNALTPAEVVKVIVDGENEDRLTVVVPDQQQSIAIGRRGQNVELARQLTGAFIEIVSETEETERRSQERTDSVAAFTELLDIDEFMAHFLVSEGFASIEEIAEAPVAELANLEGFTEELASELKRRAGEAATEEERVFREGFEGQGVDSLLLGLGLPRSFLSILIDKGVKSLEDFSDLSIDDVKDLMRGTSKGKRVHVSDDALGDFIMAARQVVMKGKEAND